jgi:DNA polymerase III delta prime subunit
MNTLFVKKYQPIYFNDFEMDNEIVELLNTLILMDNLNILFIGDIGSGKSSLLNAMIKQYYSNYPAKKYDENILYINSLKEQGIQYYRNDVKTFCQTCSLIKNKKKIVVLDDIDLINEQSQQVFRNCIDKYKHNVHFIASCTNGQKVIESLQSRFVIIKVKPLHQENLIKIMNKIIDQENIHIETQAKEFILSIANNNAKILINYMEKMKLINEPITLDIAQQICTNISFTTFQEYIELLKTKNLNSSIKLLYNLYDKGYSVMDILDTFFLFVKNTQCMSETIKYNIVPLLCKYISVFHNIHEDEIELALFTNNLYSIMNE